MARLNLSSEELQRRLYPYVVDEQEAQEMYDLLREHLFTPITTIGEEEVDIVEEFVNENPYGESVNWEELR